ncbi:hypothetical protein [Amycolatopsis australiensis]|uniref:Uncharacterized protein n=1 Tax=Amycolatopsis australiensis TaxID=546364 RepID=A0A1K1LMH1_9PSEU|nr:hypothetical protein [Amycolatopsis australiensis]SFW11385.1 hypothetical protein SAMN04489730_0008 [Amycolatopsis australiensis]SFW12047.1 hypothetical protein SAMN04489730_0083 [Amycolatopsis australiensis]
MITAASFPTPELALRSSDPAEQTRVRGFAQHQAAAAEALRRRLVAEWPGCRSRLQRRDLLAQAHADLVQWRYELALQAPGRPGTGIPLDPQRFRTTIRDGGPNYDRIGYLGRLRDGAHWDPATRTFQSGRPTPASEIMLRYGQLAQARFDNAGWLPNPDVLQNVVRIPSTRRQILGNRLVRGDAARAIADELTARVAARGRDTSRMETGGDLLYVVSADPDDADTIFDTALYLLADADIGDSAERLRLLQHVRYLLFQAPQTKKGSDAVTRVFLVGVGAFLLGRAPVMQSDADLRCMVLDQNHAIEMPADVPLMVAAGPVRRRGGAV